MNAPLSTPPRLGEGSPKDCAPTCSPSRFWRGSGGRWLWLLVPAIALAAAPTARAQLANSFYNITAVQTRVLPNAVQITIRTDGTVLFGGDTAEFVDNWSGHWGPKPLTAFRLRLLRARARVPSFIDISKYPVDSAVVSLGSEPLKEPFLNFWQAAPSDPRVDIQFRFYVPVSIRRFVVERSARDSYRQDEGDNGIEFGQFLGPRDVSVEIGQDHRSIVVTVISDRQDLGSGARLRRSPPESRKHRLSIEALAEGLLRVDSLHTPLPDLMDALSTASGVPLTVRADAASVDASLLMPASTLQDALRALSTAYGLNVTPRAPDEGGGYSIGHDGLTSETERIPLHNLKAVSARLLFPDFLLPMLHADIENNALLMTGPPDLVRRIARDVDKLDRPRPQVRVEATVWEVSSSDDAARILATAWTRARQRLGFDPGAGEVTYRLANDQQQEVTAALTALQSRSRARLAAKQFVLVGSGLWGSLFLGQQRYVTVVQGGWRQEVRALRLQIGYSLGVAPTVGAAGDITLELYPRLSSVDSVEAGTGLPTLGIREVSTVVRVRPDEAVIVAGLDSRLDFDTRRRFAPAAGAEALGDAVGARSRGRSQSSLILLVTARKES